MLFGLFKAIRHLPIDSAGLYGKCIMKDDDIPENFFIVQHKKATNTGRYKTLSVKEVNEIGSKHKTNLPKELDGEVYDFFVRTFEPKQRLFPAGIQAFRLGLGQPAVNFPPLTARYLYERLV